MTYEEKQVVEVLYDVSLANELLHCYAEISPHNWGLLVTASTKVFNSGLGLPSYPATRIQVSMSCNFG
jgi:hypothetical protein